MEWLNGSGQCRQRAPFPRLEDTDEDRAKRWRANWPITDETDGCGQGKRLSTPVIDAERAQSEGFIRVLNAYRSETSKMPADDWETFTAWFETKRRAIGK